MKNNKLLTIMLLMLVVAIFSFVIGEVMNSGDDDKEEVHTDSDAIEDEGRDRYCRYEDIEKEVLYLAADDEMKMELNRLIDPLNKSDDINVLYVQKMIDITGIDKKVYTGVLKNKKSEDKVTISEFEKIFSYIVDLGAVEGLSKEEIFVFESKDDVIFDGNKYYTCSIDYDSKYDDKIIQVYVKYDEIFKVLGFGNSTVVLDNVWLINSNANTCRFLYNGVEKEYNVVDETEKGHTHESCVANVEINNFGVNSFEIYDDTREVQVISTSEDGLVVSDEETIPLLPDFKIYDISGNSVVSENSLRLLMGHKKIKLVMDADKAKTAIITDELITENIRVILNNDDFSSYDMNTATVSCDTDYTITFPDGTNQHNAAGTTITIDSKNYNSGDKIIIDKEDKDGRFTIHSIIRNYGNPEYRGIIEIKIMDNSLRIINELPLEEYLYSVVANEIQSGTEMEALKAMAVCARGYAYTKMNDKSYEGYSAHLDDSSLCQVYNNVKETEAAIEAVKETYGIVPKYNDKVILALYFSTSAGVTCSNADIWGGNDYDYLESNIEDIEKSEVDLSDEETFVDFMNTNLGYDTIEKDAPFYRWNVSFTDAEITEAVMSNLDERVTMSSDNIKVKNENGDFVPSELTDIGTILSIKITERSTSGVVISMEIEGSKATIRVSGQTNIRNLITPEKQEINKNDGSVVTGWTSLPSPYYYIEKNDNGYTIYGGGFGHGAGMSQIGAQILAEQGYDYEYILKHYYSDITFDTIYEIEDIEE